MTPNAAHRTTFARACLTAAGIAAAGLLAGAIVGAASDVRLVQAAARQDVAAVRALLAERVDVSAAQEDGTTPIAWAAHWNHVAMAQLLIAAGANVNLATDLGVTPLSLACANGSAAMVELLLDAGANPDSRRITGETPLMACARTGSVLAVHALLARGADIDAKQASGQTALMWAIAGQQIAAARALIEHGADVHTRSAGGFTPMLFAGQQSSLEAAQILVAAGANVNDVAPDGSSVLLLSVAGTHPVGDAKVTLERPDDLPLDLLEKGADPNRADGHGFTPLHWAAQRGRTKLVDALLMAGALPNARVLSDPPPPSGSFTYSTKGLALATPFWLATRAGHLEVMRALAARGADVSLAGGNGMAPLMLAIGSGRGQMSSTRNARELVALLLDLGADVHAVNSAGQTALHAAATAGANDLVRMLVDNGASIDARDKRGETPLTLAERRADKSTADLLRQLAVARPVNR